MILSPSIYSDPNDLSSEKICKKCRARNDSQSSGMMKPLEAKNIHGIRVPSVSKNMVICLCTLIFMALFGFVTIRFLPPFGSRTENPDHKKYFISSASIFSLSGQYEAQIKDSQNFIINPKKICDADAIDGIDLLLLVASSVENFYQRQAIRDMWGSLTTKRGCYRLGFMVGSTVNFTMSQLLQEESEKYQDVIQSDAEGIEQKLIPKCVAMLIWAAEFCSHAKYFLKADDDIYIHFEILSTILNNDRYLPNENFITRFLKSGIFNERETMKNDILF